MTRAREGGRRSAVSPTMALPALVLFAAFALLPMVLVFALSFTRWNGLEPPRWNGLGNWRDLAADPVSHLAVWLTVKMMVLSWLVQTPIALLLGVFLAGHQRYRGVLAVLYFVPLLLATVAIGITFRNLLDPNFGLGQSSGLGFLALDWLGDSGLAFYAMVGVIAWQYIPFHTLLYQAGVRQIPTTLYEAARMDGAGRLGQFWYITLPQLRYTIVTSTTLILVGSLTTFDVVFVMTGGGPGYGTRLLALDMYLDAFARHQMGRASAAAALLVVAGLVLSLALLRFSGFTRMQSRLEGL
jgi:raffinose/stachyose/melibiose transport system permease protein